MVNGAVNGVTHELINTMTRSENMMEKTIT